MYYCKEVKIIPLLEITKAALTAALFKVLSSPTVQRALAKPPSPVPVGRVTRDALTNRKNNKKKK